MRKLLALAWLVVVVGLVGPVGPVAADETWQLVWSDDFDYTGLPDSAKWDYEEGFLRNQESQYYRRACQRNSWVQDGELVLRAIKERISNPEFRPGADKNDWKHHRGTATYSSASLTSRGKASWRHARIEVRAKLPAGRGMWPAIWMLGDSIRDVGWPACGEIDIMEYVGFAPDTIHANVHTAKYNHVLGNGKGSKTHVPEPDADFHVYAVEWNETQMDFFVDGAKHFTYRNEGSGNDAWPFDDKFYLILNVAVGGTWGGMARD